MIASDILVLLACPRCDSRPPLRQEEDSFLVCTECGWAYPVLNGIPHLLIEEAIPPGQIKNHGSNET